MSFEEAQEAFYDKNAIINEDDEHSLFEKRYFCIGKTEKDILTVRFTYRNIWVQGIGENKKDIMNRKIIYTDAPPEIEEAFARSVRVKDFLPPPGELVLKKSEKQKVLMPQQKTHYASARPKATAMA